MTKQEARLARYLGFGLANGWCDDRLVDEVVRVRHHSLKAMAGDDVFYAAVYAARDERLEVRG